MLCSPPQCGTGLAGTRAHKDAQTHGRARTHGHTVCTRAHSGRCLLSQEDSSLERILGHKSSGSLSSLKSGLKLHLLFTALLLV